MTPKEKAIELVDKFFDRALPDAVENDYHVGVRCALIAVDEIINSHLLSEKNIFDVHPVDYWQEVKQEIEKL